MMTRMILATIIIACWCPFAAAAFPSGLLAKPDAWFKSPEGRTAVACVLSWQSAAGSWPKNQDNTSRQFSGNRSSLAGTFDNGSTTDELRFLARAIRATGEDSCTAAFRLGLDHILQAQYPNGGWPQYHPPGKAYHRHITFNDDSMVRLMEFLGEVASSGDFPFVDPKRRATAGIAVRRGIDCILKCQVMVHGKPTVWCAQHDEVTLAPTAARAYELPSLSGAESAGILRFLMKIEQPGPEVVRAVRAGVAWFESAKLTGIRIEQVDGDRKVIKDGSAPPLWARFYEIETSRPFFCDRDGVRKFTLAEISKERRNGYAWYGNWGDAVAKAYARWPHR